MGAFSQHLRSGELTLLPLLTKEEDVKLGTQRALWLGDS